MPHRTLQSASEIADFADALPVAIWVGRVPSGDCVYVNGAFRAVLGLDPPEGAARGNYVGPYSVHTRDGRPYPEHLMPFEQAVTAAGPIEIDDLVIHGHDGARTYLRVYARPLFDDSGVITHIVEAFTDITREVVSEQAQREREVQLRQAQRMDSLGGLAGGIAHDFNNLLTVVKMIASQLGEQATDPAARLGLARIDEVTESAAGLTRALLGFARQGNHLRQSVSVNEMVVRIGDMARRTVGRQISVEVDVPALALFVEGDPGQLEQLLMNLVVNAKEAIEGSGRIVLRAAPAPFGVERVEIDVEDSGPGIPPSLQERVFEPYFTTKKGAAGKGTGLGLATVFGVAESHHGSVSILRSDASGTTMRVRLPRSLAPPSSVETASSSPAVAASVPPSKGTILVVDDEAMVLEVMSESLRMLGYRVVSAPGGVEAVEAFRREPAVFDAVLLDLVMPRMGGREVYQHLSALRPDVRVVLITGYALNHQVQELLDLGVKALLNKPFSVARLSAAVAAVLPAGGPGGPTAT